MPVSNHSNVLYDSTAATIPTEAIVTRVAQKYNVYGIKKLSLRKTPPLTPPPPMVTPIPGGS